MCERGTYMLGVGYFRIEEKGGSAYFNLCILEHDVWVRTRDYRSYVSVLEKRYVIGRQGAVERGTRAVALQYSFQALTYFTLILDSHIHALSSGSHRQRNYVWLNDAFRGLKDDYIVRFINAYLNFWLRVLLRVYKGYGRYARHSLIIHADKGRTSWGLSFC